MSSDHNRSPVHINVAVNNSNLSEDGNANHAPGTPGPKVPRSMARMVREAQVHAEKRISDLEQRAEAAERARRTAIGVAAGLYKTAIALRKRVIVIGYVFPCRVFICSA